MNISSHLNQVNRNPAVSGTFYPADKESLTNDLSILFQNSAKTFTGSVIRAIISPHAGYVFSGKIAASAVSTISPEADYSNVFIIGSSHRLSFNGASVYNIGDFITPLGVARVNREIGDSLIKDSGVFSSNIKAHSNEHSIEVQIPLLQYYFKKEIPIVPIIIGTGEINTLKEIAITLKPWFSKENLFIISSDFSHYPTYNDALETDSRTAQAILTGDPENLQKILKLNAGKDIPGLATSMCGWSSGLILMYLAQFEKGLEFKKVAYSNSGDSPYGDKKEVVGYMAIALTDKVHKNEFYKETLEADFMFTDTEKSKLISIARESLNSLFNDSPPLIDPDELPDALRKNLAAFVSLRVGKNLRGCIGTLKPSAPLYKTIIDMSVAAASEDTRFDPIGKDEITKVHIEISVLGTLRKTDDINEIELGKHGIYIKKGNHNGIMLPQVPINQGWNLEEFLGHTSRDKAGIGWLGWKKAEIYIFEAYVIEE